MLGDFGWAGAVLAFATCLFSFPLAGEAATRVRNNEVRRREFAHEQSMRRKAETQQKVSHRKELAQAFKAAQQAEEAALGDLRSDIEKLTAANETAQAAEKQHELNRRLRQLWERQEEWARDQRHLDPKGGLVVVFQSKPPSGR